MSIHVDLTGKRFDQLLVVKSKGRVKCGNQKVWLWEVKCDCGKVLTVRSSNLVRKYGAKTKSCGCLKGLHQRTHGLSVGGKRTPQYAMWSSAKHRAKVKGLPFSITPLDIKIPDVCPMFGTKLELGKCRVKGQTRANAASLDRVVPKLGYVTGNIRVISYRANTMKSNASLEEIKRLAEWLQGETDARTECTA